MVNNFPPASEMRKTAVEKSDLMRTLEKKIREQSSKGGLYIIHNGLLAESQISKLERLGYTVTTILDSYTRIEWRWNVKTLVWNSSCESIITGGFVFKYHSNVTLSDIHIFCIDFNARRLDVKGGIMFLFVLSLISLLLILQLNVKSDLYFVLIFVQAFLTGNLFGKLLRGNQKRKWIPYLK